MNGIRITLTNGEQSPCFMASDCHNVASIGFRQDLTAKKIAMVVGPNTCKAIRITDGYNQELFKWVGQEETAYREQAIPEGEELVGIYGSQDQVGWNNIMNFGFITANYPREKR